MTNLSRNSKAKLALRAWAAMHRRQRALEPAAAAFEAAVPDRIRGDERFQAALEDAETAASLQRAMARHEGEVEEWVAAGVALLRAIESADGAYEQELCEALETYRESITGGKGGSDTNGVEAH